MFSKNFLKFLEILKKYRLVIIPFRLKKHPKPLVWGAYAQSNNDRRTKRRPAASSL